MAFSRLLVLPAGFAVMAGGLAASANAQEPHRIVVTPYAGVFVPSARVAEFKSVGGGTQTVMGIRQQSALAMGLTAAYSLNRFAGIELGGAWAFSDMKASPGLSGVISSPSLSRSESARVLMGSAKLILNLMPITERSALRLGVGPAIIRRGGGAYKADDNGDFSGLTDFGGAISLCSRLPLTDFLSLRIRAENYMYSSRLAFRDFTDPSAGVLFGSRVQNDFIFSAGLQMVWWR